MDLFVEKKRGAKGSLYKVEQHRADKATAALNQIGESLRKTFEIENLSISRSTLHRFMRVSCALSMKRLEKTPARRNHTCVIEKRKIAVETRLGQ